MKERYDIRSLFPEEIRDILKAEGIEPYRARQIVSWLEKGAADFGQMTISPILCGKRLIACFGFPT